MRSPLKYLTSPSLFVGWQAVHATQATDEAVSLRQDRKLDSVGERKVPEI